MVSPSYFETLGVHPALGRFEGARGAAEIVISDRFWRERLGADPAIVGKALRINGHPCTVIGVGPEDFRGASPLMYGADIWVPATIDPAIVPELADKALERYDREALPIRRAAASGGDAEPRGGCARRGGAADGRRIRRARPRPQGPPRGAC